MSDALRGKVAVHEGEHRPLTEEEHKTLAKIGEFYGNVATNLASIARDCLTATTSDDVLRLDKRIDALDALADTLEDV